MDALDGKNYIYIKAPLLTLNILNVFLHSVGIALLVSASKPINSQRLGECKQSIFLINLSIAEILFNFVEALRVILLLLEHIDNSEGIETAREYLLIINFTTIWLQVVVALFGMTIDRLMNVMLEHRYPLYWSKKKSKYYLYFGWIANACLGITISLAHCFHEFPWDVIFFLYVYPIIDAAFILLAAVTYILIFRKYKQSQRFRLLSVGQISISGTENPVQQTEINKTSTKSFLNFVKTRFYVPIMLVLTFIIFIVIPDLSYVAFGLYEENEERQTWILAACSIFYAVENICDVIIYVFLQPNVRKHLEETIRYWCVKFVREIRR